MAKAGWCWNHTSWLLGDNFVFWYSTMNTRQKIMLVSSRVCRMNIDMRVVRHGTAQYGIFQKKERKIQYGFGHCYKNILINKYNTIKTFI